MKDPDERKMYQLSPEQIAEIKALARFPNEAFKYWKALASDMELDARTILSHPGYKFSALARSHRKHWCWPAKLRCQRDPVEVAL